MSQFTPTGLRVLCNAVAAAVREGSELNLFDADAPAKYATMILGEKEGNYDLQAQISDALRLLLQEVYAHAEPFISSPPQDGARDIIRLEGHHYVRDEAGPTRRDVLGPDYSCGVTNGGLVGEGTAQFEGLQCAGEEYGCEYFTCVKVSKVDVPWHGKEPWKLYEIEGLEDASDAWTDQVFRAVGQTMQ